MYYAGRSLIHDPKFERDCEQFFGSIERADERLATFLFELGHGIAVGTEIAPWVTAFMVHDDHSLVVIAEFRGEYVLLRRLVALDISVELAA